MQSGLAASGLATITLAAGAAHADAALRVCSDRGYEDLKARAITCDAAERVYRQSLHAARGSGSARTTFRRRGIRWSCQAFNPPAVAFYTWRCTARGNRLMQYRWKSGE
ncbi:hypothetical protein BDZ31_002014 [Conexibacter arvalis]|uniref:Uncharacterized protein n=2 Tax=Conexibacter arvalis TaxID=912552 RepID=A0A840IEI8_9ACTN|nr:hypothetical protein [Conexibacter arvalis]